eukprot:m51a1_g2475 hypothetical protein (1083) ;mRNA; r:54255-59023
MEPGAGPVRPISPITGTPGSSGAPFDIDVESWINSKDEPWHPERITGKLTPEVLRAAIKRGRLMEPVAKVKLLVSLVPAAPRDRERMAREISELLGSARADEDEWVACVADLLAPLSSGSESLNVRPAAREFAATLEALRRAPPSASACAELVPLEAAFESGAACPAPPEQQRVHFRAREIARQEIRAPVRREAPGASALKRQQQQQQTHINAHKAAAAAAMASRPLGSIRLQARPQHRMKTIGIDEVKGLEARELAPIAPHSKPQHVEAAPSPDLAAAAAAAPQGHNKRPREQQQQQQDESEKKAARTHSDPAAKKQSKSPRVPPAPAPAPVVVPPAVLSSPAAGSPVAAPAMLPQPMALSSSGSTQQQQQQQQQQQHVPQPPSSPQKASLMLAMAFKQHHAPMQGAPQVASPQQQAAPAPVMVSAQQTLNQLRQEPSNALTQEGREAIERFLSGIRDPQPPGTVRQIPVHAENRVLEDGTVVCEQIVFEINYDKGVWKKLRKRIKVDSGPDDDDDVPAHDDPRPPPRGRAAAAAARPRSAARLASRGRGRGRREDDGPAADVPSPTDVTASSPPRQRRPPQGDAPDDDDERAGRRKPSRSTASSLRAGDSTQTSAASGELGDERAALRRRPAGVTHEPLVEDPVTGRFRGARAQQPARASERRAGAELEVAADEAQLEEAAQRSGPAAFEAFADGARTGLRAAYGCCAGLLGGMSLALLVVCYASPGGNAEVLRRYSDTASAFQRAFFVLTSLTLLGSCDKLSLDRRRAWNGHAVALPAVDVALCLVYLATLVFSVAAASTDDIIYYSQSRMRGWFDDPQLLDGSFDGAMRTWHALHILRLAGSLVGWALFALSDPFLKLDAPPVLIPPAAECSSPAISIAAFKEEELEAEKIEQRLRAGRGASGPGTPSGIMLSISRSQRDGPFVPSLPLAQQSRREGEPEGGVLTDMSKCHKACIRVLSFLGPRDLCRLQQTCKFWYQMGTNNEAWLVVLETEKYTDTGVTWKRICAELMTQRVCARPSCELSSFRICDGSLCNDPNTGQSVREYHGHWEGDDGSESHDSEFDEPDADILDLPDVSNL